MIAMLLAAGKGTRMLPLTADRPKPLLSVGNDTLLGYQIQRLVAAGAEKIVVNAAYLGEQVEQYIADKTPWPVPITVSRESEPLETAGGINHALPHLGGKPFILANGDVWCEYDLSDWVDPGLPADVLGHLLLVANPGHNPQGDFSLVNSKVVAPVQGQASYTYSGLALLHPNLIAQYPRRRACFGLKEVFDWAIAQGRLTGQVYPGYWLDVGTPERLGELRARVTGG